MVDNPDIKEELIKAKTTIKNMCTDCKEIHYKDKQIAELEKALFFCVDGKNALIIAKGFIPYNPYNVSQYKVPEIDPDDRTSGINCMVSKPVIGLTDNFEEVDVYFNHSSLDPMRIWAGVESRHYRSDIIGWKAKEKKC